MTDEEMADKYVRSQGNANILNLGENTVDLSFLKRGVFLDGLKEGRPKWHKVVDGDLPEHEVNVLVLYNVRCVDIAHYNYDYKEWHFADSIVRNVIAWCEIPKYTEEGK